MEQLRRVVLKDSELCRILLDPITLEIMEDPVIAADDMTYSRTTIELWFHTRERQGLSLTSPLTGALLADKSLRKNLALIPLLEKAQETALKGSKSSWSADIASVAAATVPEAPVGLRDLSPTVFTELDRVMSLRLIRDMKLKPAQVVVLGMESHGKSTLLERLIGLPLFPKDKVRCTTCIIRVHLRRGPAQLASVCIRSRESLEESEKVDVALEKICAEVRRWMEIIRCGEPDRVISAEQEILVSIQLPFVPNLDIVDLPGLVAANTGKRARDVDQDLCTATFELAESVIQSNRKNSIFLLAVDVRTQVNHSRAAELVRIHSIESQTIGVFTKLDVYVNEDEDDDNDMLTHKLLDTELLLTHGWLACSNRMPATSSYSKDIDRLCAMEDAEERLLQTSAAGGNGKYLAMGKAGMPLIRKVVQDLFEDFLCHSWIPSIQKALKKEFVQLSSQNAVMGLPILGPVSLQQAEIILELKHAIQEADPQYNISIFDPVDNKTMLDIVKCKVYRAIEVSINKLSLSKDASLWTVVKEYDDMIKEREREWNVTKQSRPFYRDSMNDQDEDDTEQRPNPLHSSNVVKKEAMLILRKLIQELCIFLLAEKSSIQATFHLKLDDVLSQRSMRNETVFDELEKGKYFNIHLFPFLMSVISDKLQTLLQQAAEELQQELLSALDTFASLPLSFTIPHHSFFDGRHINKLQWSEQGKVFAHLVIDMFSEKAEQILPTTLVSMELPEYILDNQEGIAERSSLLGSMLACLQVKKALTKVEAEKPSRYFCRRKKGDRSRQYKQDGGEGELEDED